MVLVVTGRVDTVEYARAEKLVQYLRDRKEIRLNCRMDPKMETQWDQFKAEMTHRFNIFDYPNSCFVYDEKDNAVIGNGERFIQWSSKEFQYSDGLPVSYYEDRAQELYAQYMKDSKNVFCYMDISIGGVEPRRVLFELFASCAKRVVENFRCLCTGEMGEEFHYKGSVFHRIVKGGWVQGGDICGGRGDSGKSIFGASFSDENYTIRHDAPGILAMANSGPHTNGSQFFISLQALPFMDKKAVAFGRVVEGMSVVDDVAAVEINFNERPVIQCMVVGCGQVSLEAPQINATKEAVAPAMVALPSPLDALNSMSTLTSTEEE